MRGLAPHWGALLALALFLIVGLAILDDYGVARDVPWQRDNAIANLAYLLGVSDTLALAVDHDKFYGMALNLPLLLIERAFGLQDFRAIHLSLHLGLHLFFLMGGLFAYLLAHRLFGNRLIALAAMLIFLLHPRLYAHAFFNSKDPSFSAMFMIALFLTREAFSRDKVGAFALLGVGVGVLVNLRVMGVMLLAAIPALRAFDFVFAQGWLGRKRVLITTGAFALGASLSIYVLLPYLWSNPLGRGAEWWPTLADHPHKPSELFRGMFGRSVEFTEYLPVWFSITSPPFALALGLAGAAVVLARAARDPWAAMRKGRLRFGLLLVGCVAALAFAVVVLNANVHTDWRHLYFIWAPFSLLGALGLAWAASALRRARLRAAVYVAAGAGLAATAITMVLIHPNQQAHFNFFVDRVAPEHLRTQYSIFTWNHPRRQAIEWLADNAPLLPDEAQGPQRTKELLDRMNLEMLPEAARARIANVDFEIVPEAAEHWGRRPLHRVNVYGNTLMTIELKDDLRAVYESTLSREPILDAAFDAYRLDDAVALVMEPCAPAFIERVEATLRVSPVDIEDLPPWREGRRFEPRRFHHAEYGALFDGKCIASLPLPDYPIADIEIVWSPLLLDDNEARALMRRAKADGQALARSFYDIHLADGELVYVKENCDPLQTEHPFFLDIYPQRTSDLPKDRQARGYERSWFAFHDQHGAFVEEACVALVPLPDYPIAAFRTGQRIGDDDGNLWRASFSANPEPYRAVLRAAASTETAARSVFDVHLADGALVYVKEPCEQADTETRFFLHVVPRSADDLPEDRREYGFNGLDFDFFLNGAWFDGKCAARVPLPDYPIASARTGQHISGVRETWSVELAAPGR